MFRRMEDFRTAWQWEAQRTLALFEAVPDAAMGQAVAEGHRDLRRMAWHLVESVIEMPGHVGLQVEGAALIHDGFIGAPPTTMAEIRETYARASASLLKGLEAWSDADLEREDELYGQTWKRGQTLFVLILHQVHHRGQMTVLLRQAGLPVPDTYGPPREGWSAFGLDAPKV